TGQTAPPVQQPQRTTRPQAPVASQPPPKPQVEKAADATRLAVFGDSMAIDLSNALERRYAEDANLVVVIKQGISSSGFVRDDFFDWNAALRDQIAADSFDLAIVIIGINDWQELKENGVTLAPLTEAWTSAYQAHMTEFLSQLRVAHKPMIWVGLPPQWPKHNTRLRSVRSPISNAWPVSPAGRNTLIFMNVF
ncbi:MAG: DUF459 domain-containing protein, partial [Candidatus Devosia euplotis]|nr:DUF459 domain-containing protein [Candidatus Devosia euplotis]